jgi:hypothetical protein
MILADNDFNFNCRAQNTKTYWPAIKFIILLGALISYGLSCCKKEFGI